ncbi:MAG: hypothetical protein IJ464_01335 [Alistipes sp.]|nr:hypothetical protein [Alistipes sp.]
MIIDLEKPHDRYYPAGIELSPGDTIEFQRMEYSASEKDPLNADDRQIVSLANAAILNGATVIYDDKYAITYLYNGEHTALCDYESYVPKRTGDLCWRFTYHFTDEDYEYAREHGREY